MDLVYIHANLEQPRTRTDPSASSNLSTAGHQHGAACYALKDRDHWISWSTVQRLERLKLIVQRCRGSRSTPGTVRCLIHSGRVDPMYAAVNGLAVGPFNCEDEEEPYDSGEHAQVMLDIIQSIQKTGGLAQFRRF